MTVGREFGPLVDFLAWSMNKIAWEQQVRIWAHLFKAVRDRQKVTMVSVCSQKTSSLPCRVSGGPARWAILRLGPRCSGSPKRQPTGGTIIAFSRTLTLVSQGVVDLLIPPEVRTHKAKPNMISTIIKKLFGTSHEREVKRLQPLVARINQLKTPGRKRATSSCAG